ncbi:xanthine dehydrogenase accessory protein XdhC [Aurantimonas sp. Leaf443]|uniref:xanthine dehydrogenase accessory protein XdhC n=1 Tax=Aurantimonas sp. Leaf443 TaxID=1736378 RepID=UPI0006F20DC2|nr:xanthine dehydrogenase accessory protein XdhC [Aurantimonas sp. Leaf443]KQT85190.1 xanthine dehydrogenase accessory protein XdhC [Aurantimonas sp. Leaf443]
MTLPAGHLATLLARGEPTILVTVTQAYGSTPREAGAAMAVTAGGSAGTIGGGRLEYDAIARARAMLVSGDARGEMAVPLGPEIGQCCGGHVRLSLRRLDRALLGELDEAERANRASLPLALILGAGHTGRALALALSPLPIRTRLVDTRPETLRDGPAGVETVAAALPEAEIEAAPAGTAYLVMTHDHGLDFLLAAAALGRADAAYVGMIGSRTKGERFRRHLAAEGRGAEFTRLTLPIGGSALRDKRPAVIAALTAAEIVVCLLSKQAESLHDRFASPASAHPGAIVRSRG